MPALTDRHVLLTGASGALAGAVARRLFAAGARVSGLDRDDNVHQRFGALSPEAAPFVASLTDPSQVEAAFSAAESRHGPLWGVVHVAGGWRGGSPVADTDLATLDAMLDTNLRTTFVVAAAAMRRFRSHGGGCLVTTGSITAAQGVNLAGAAAYNASKAAVIALTKALAEEGLPRGIRACVLAPGTMDTPANRAAMPNVDPALWVSPDAVAQGVLAALDPASALTGAVLTFPARG